MPAITIFTFGNFADIRIQYRHPNSTEQQFADFTSNFNYIPFEEADHSYQFSTAVIMFGSLLKESAYMKDISWNDVLLLAERSIMQDDLLQKEFISIVQQAKTLYTKVKKKKGSTAHR